MNTSTSPQDYPSIPISISLNVALVDVLDKKLLIDDLEQMIQDLMTGLGIPGYPVLKVDSLANDLNEKEHGLNLSLDGLNCFYSEYLPRRAYEYISGVNFDPHTRNASLISSLLDLPKDQVAEYVTLMCVEILKNEPARLLTSEMALIYHQKLLEIHDSPFLPSVTQLELLLAEVLNQRISIKDQGVVARVLLEGISNEKPFRAIAEDLIAALRPTQIQVRLPAEYLKELTLNMEESEGNAFSLMRDGLFFELGARYPDIHFVPTDDLVTTGFQFKFNDLMTIPQRGLSADVCFVNENPDRLKLLGLTGQAFTNPASQSLGSVVPNSAKSLVEEMGLITWSQIRYLTLAMSSELRTHAAIFLDQNKTQEHLNDIDSGLVRAANAKVPIETLTEVLRILLAEEVSIRNLKGILESIVEHGFDDSILVIPNVALFHDQDMKHVWAKEPANIATFVRVSLSRYLSRKYSRGQNTLVTFLLDSDIQELLTNDSLVSPDVFLMQMNSGDREMILAAVRGKIGNLLPTDQKLVCLTTLLARPLFRKLIEKEFSRLAVLSYDELTPDINIQPIGRIS